MCAKCDDAYLKIVKTESRHTLDTINASGEIQDFASKISKRGFLQVMVLTYLSLLHKDAEADELKSILKEWCADNVE